VRRLNFSARYREGWVLRICRGRSDLSVRCCLHGPPASLVVASRRGGSFRGPQTLIPSFWRGRPGPRQPVSRLSYVSTRDTMAVLQVQLARHLFLVCWGRKNIPGSRPTESKCVKYLQHQFLLCRREVASKEGERSRVTDVVEIHACNAAARYPWTHYSCAPSPDGLMNDDVCWFPFFFKRVCRVSAKIKSQHDTVTGKLTHIRIDTL
jgi:hypothetical protein